MLSTEDEVLRKVFGKVLRSLRQERALSHGNYARKVHTTGGHLNSLEFGRADPKLTMIFRLAEAMGISPVVLIREVWQQLKKETDP